MTWETVAAWAVGAAVFVTGWLVTDQVTVWTAITLCRELLRC